MPVAACQPLLPSALRPNSNTSGIADGSIIAAIITTQLAVNDSKEPRPIPMSPLDRDSRTTSAHAIAATIKKASAAKAGGASSTSPPRCSPAPANRNRQAGQNPRRLVGLISPVADSVRLSDINRDTRPAGGARNPARHRLRLDLLERGPCSGRRRSTCPALVDRSNTCGKSARHPSGKRRFPEPLRGTTGPPCSYTLPFPRSVALG